MVTRRRSRRIGPSPPELVGQLRLGGIPGLEANVATQVERSWDDAVRRLEDFLKNMQLAADDGLPAGAYEDKPETIRAGHSGAVGDSGLGWSPGPHDHQVLTAPALALGTANAEGTGLELARADHVHKRDILGRLDGVDIGVRGALNFLDSASIDFSVSDDPGNDELEVTADVIPAGAGITLQVAYDTDPTVPQITVNDGQPLTIDLTSAGQDVFALRNNLNTDILRASDTQIFLGSNSVYDLANDRLGINQVAPTRALQVVGRAVLGETNVGALAGNIEGITGSLGANPGVGSAAFYKGLVSFVTMSGATNGTTGDLYGYQGFVLKNANAAASTVRHVYGIAGAGVVGSLFAATNDTITGDCVGLRGQVQTFSTNAGTLCAGMYGVQVTVAQRGTGTVPNSYGFYSRVIQVGAGTTTNMYGLWVEAQTLGGTVTNSYGVWIANLGAGTNNFGLVLAGDSAGSDIYLGAGQDARIYYDGSDLVLDPDFVGTGRLLVGATGDDDVLLNDIEIDGDLDHDGAGVGFYGTAPIAQPTVTGSRGGNVALANLLTALANMGLIVDNTVV